MLDPVERLLIMLDCPSSDGGACVERQACADWLRDLRLLEMRPTIGLAGGIVDSR